MVPNIKLHTARRLLYANFVPWCGDIMGQVVSMLTTGSSLPFFEVEELPRVTHPRQFLCAIQLLRQGVLNYVTLVQPLNWFFWIEHTVKIENKENMVHIKHRFSHHGMGNGQVGSTRSVHESNSWQSHTSAPESFNTSIHLHTCVQYGFVSNWDGSAWIIFGTSSKTANAVNCLGSCSIF